MSRRRSPFFNWFAPPLGKPEVAGKRVALAKQSG
jgi:hypothetical protein